jgi:hypothetical protein
MLATSRTGTGLLAVVCVAAAIRFLHLQWMADQPIAEYQVTWTECDMATHWEWSTGILGGDLLGRELRQPYLAWMQQIAPRETWERWRGGGRVFFKAPLYAYALAVMRRVGGDGYPWLGFCHLALGVLNCALIFVLANRFFGTIAAVAAGLGAAVYGPFLLYDALYLRDGLLVTVSLLLLWGLARCMDEGRWPWFAAGLLCALALLGRELTLLFVPFVGLWALQRFRPRWRVVAGVLGCFGAGVVVGLAPLVARNVAVGAPPWALSAVGPEGIIYGHAADSWPAGFWMPASAPSILRQADGSASATVRLTLETYGGDWWRLLRNEGARLAAIFASYDAPDDANWYYFADRSRLLRWTIGWEVVVAFGLVGLWIGRGDRRQRLLQYFLLSCLLGLQYTAVVGRYRLVPAAVLLVYAGVAVEHLVRAAGSRRWTSLAVTTAAVLTMIAVSRQLLPWQGARFRLRPVEFLLAAQVYNTRRQGERVYEELQSGLETAYAGPGQRELPPEYLLIARSFVEVAQASGRGGAGAAVLKRLIRVYDADPHLPRLLHTLEGS